MRSKRCCLTLLFCTVFAVIMSCARSNVHVDEAFALRPGDLLFQDLDCGDLCDAIETVTQGVDGAKFSHVGMVSDARQGKVRVIEAIGAGVVETSLDDFLNRSANGDGTSRVLVGRIEGPQARLIPGAIRAARSFRGLPYDSVYEIDNSSFYCSELIYEAFRQANDGTPIFELAPMTFKDPLSGATFPAWVDYYRKLNIAVPEGEPGLNPGGMSRAPFVRIVHAYGRPDGWTGD